MHLIDYFRSSIFVQKIEHFYIHTLSLDLEDIILTYPLLALRTFTRILKTTAVGMELAAETLAFFAHYFIIFQGECFDLPPCRQYHR